MFFKKYLMVIATAIFSCMATEDKNSQMLEYLQPEASDTEKYATELRNTTVVMCIPFYYDPENFDKDKVARFTRDLTNSLEENYKILNSSGCEMKILFRIDNQDEWANTENEIINEALKEKEIGKISSIKLNPKNYGFALTKVLLQELDAKEYIQDAIIQGRNSYITYMDPDDTINPNYLKYSLLTAFKTGVLAVCCDYAIRNFKDQAMTNQPGEHDEPNSRISPEELLLQQYSYGQFEIKPWTPDNALDTTAMIFNSKNLFNSETNEWKTYLAGTCLLTRIAFEPVKKCFKNVRVAEFTIDDYQNACKQTAVNLKVPQHEIHCTRGVKEKNLYDAGLYNYRSHSNQMSTCESTHVNRLGDQLERFVTDQLSYITPGLIQWIIQLFTENTPESQLDPYETSLNIMKQKLDGLK